MTLGTDLLRAASGRYRWSGYLGGFVGSPDHGDYTPFIFMSSCNVSAKGPTVVTTSGGFQYGPPNGYSEWGGDTLTAVGSAAAPVGLEAGAMGYWSAYYLDQYRDSTQGGKYYLEFDFGPQDTLFRCGGWGLTQAIAPDMPIGSTERGHRLWRYDLAGVITGWYGDFQDAANEGTFMADVFCEPDSVMSLLVDFDEMLVEYRSNGNTIYLSPPV